MVTLTVLMGPPGAGKTTWMQANPGSPGRVLCSTERLRTNQAMQSKQAAIVAYLATLRRRAEQGLRAGHDVLVDGCNTRRGDRTGWLRIARECSARTHLVVFDTPLPELLRVQIERGDKGVPEYKVRQYHQEYLRALPAIPREGWARVTHVRRVSPQPKSVSKW